MNANAIVNVIVMHTLSKHTAVAYYANTNLQEIKKCIFFLSNVCVLLILADRLTRNKKIPICTEHTTPFNFAYEMKVIDHKIDCSDFSWGNYEMTEESSFVAFLYCINLRIIV